MVYSPTPPATTSPPPPPNKITPAPWVPFTRAGCNVGDFSTANVELENTGPDIPKVFGPNSPEEKQLKADKDPFKDAETADYVGIAVHCAKGQAFCKNAMGIKFGQTKPTHTARPDKLPDEPGGYTGYQGLFGARYVAPQLGAGTPNVMHNGYEVTNAAGNLVDLNGNEIDGAFLTNHPGFPGFDPTASQTLAYMADMLESGVSVVGGYIADIHGNQNQPQTPACNVKNAPGALGSGTKCYIEQAQYWNQAFGIFFKRLAADGITPQNSLFVFSSDEGDHEAGANVGRALQPTPANCDGAKVVGNTVKPDVLCTYPTGTFGQLTANISGLLGTQTHNKTPFSLEDDTAPEFYVPGQPGPDVKSVRSLEHAVASLTARNPYTATTQPVTNYLADPAEEAILHMVDADPARTPTFAMFGRPDYFFQTGPSTCSPCVSQSTDFAYDHGDYAAEIDTNWLGIAGPGVKHLGLDGTSAAKGPNSAGADSGQVTVPGSGTTGPWTDETDIRPTIMYLAGLKDDYEHDGRVITQILTNPNPALSAKGVTALGECYKQLNSSVGELGTATLQAATKAIEGSSNSAYKATDKALVKLDQTRDALAGTIKGDLEAAAFANTPVPSPGALTASCQKDIKAAEALAGS
jgi:hypothetical protein